MEIGETTHEYRNKKALEEALNRAKIFILRAGTVITVEFQLQ